MSEETKPTKSRGKGSGKKSGRGETEGVVIIDKVAAIEVPEQDVIPGEEEVPTVTKVNINTIDKDSVPYTEQVLKESKTIEELFDKLSDSKLVSNVISKLSSYRTRMIEPHTEQQGVNLQYLMYTLFIEVLNESNYGLFNLKFKVLNKVFALNKGSTFTSIGLSKYDYHWKWGVKSHEVYFKLVAIITQLSIVADRKNNLKTMDFNKGIENISNTAKQNLIRFYK